MTLKLTGIEVECIIGERPEEREQNQRLRIDLLLTIGDRAADTDELVDTVDYVELTEGIRKVLTEAKCRMIERAAKIVCEECLCRKGVKWAEVRVTKAGSVEHLESATAIYGRARKR